MSEAKFTVTANGVQKAWIDQQSRKTGMSIREFFRKLIDAAQSCDWDPSGDFAPKRQHRIDDASNEDIKEMSPDEKLVFFTRKLFDIKLASEKAKLDQDELGELLQDKALVRRLYYARSLYLAETVHDLNEVGAGRQSGNSAALTALLSAHHPNFGSARKKSFDAVIGPLIEEIAHHGKSEFSRLEGGLAAFKRFLKKVLEDIKYYRGELPG